MWVFLNNAMVSIVEDFSSPDYLCVRARKKGDIERAFPGAKEIAYKKTDYAYRAYIKRDKVALRMAQLVKEIDYTNFKGSIPFDDKERHDAYFDVWSVMYEYQEGYNPFRFDYYRDDIKGSDIGVRKTQEYYDLFFNEDYLDNDGYKYNEEDLDIVESVNSSKWGGIW